MFIIVEGTDLAGKSTLVSALETRITKVRPNMPVEVLHRSRPVPETRRQVLHDYVMSVDPFTHPLHSRRQSLICDRWHFGERTYAPTKRPHTNTDGYGLLGRAGWRWTELFLLSRGAATFWLRQPLEVLMARSGRGDDYVGTHELEGLLRAYDAAMKLSPSYVETLTPDPNDSSMSMLVDHIVSRAIKAEESVRLLRHWPEYIGPPNPRALLVGDRRNITIKFGDETRLPFMPVAGNSGNFLLDRLDDVTWRDVGLVNGYEVRNTLGGLWTALRKPQVICLGREAEKAVTTQLIPRNKYVTVPHPLYVKRFRYADGEEYAAAIREAAKTGEVALEWRM